MLKFKKKSSYKPQSPKLYKKFTGRSCSQFYRIAIPKFQHLCSQICHQLKPTQWPKLFKMQGTINELRN
jgi:hypothetical protein